MKILKITENLEKIKSLPEIHKNGQNDSNKAPKLRRN